MNAKRHELTRRAMWRIAAAGALLGVLAPPASGAAAVPVLVVEGKGHGHGVGMAQDGAFWMGKAGASTGEILGHFYPGTTMSRASGQVRVPVLTGGASAAVTLYAGGEVRDALSGAQSEGFPVRVPPGETVTISWDGEAYTVSGGTPTSASTTTTTPAPGDNQPGGSETTTTTGLLAIGDRPRTAQEPPATTTTVPQPATPRSGRSLWVVPASGGTTTVPARERRFYRGVIEATAVGGPLRLVNQLDVENYLKGLGEVRDGSWPGASLRAQVIAARTYALRAMRVAGEICDTQRCQVYLGAGAEYPAQSSAVEATAGQVLTYEGWMISAVYSANGGGHSAALEESFGATGAKAPYLRAAPYPTRDPKPWTTTITLSDVARRLDYGGDLTGARVTQRGPSGRALEVTVDGSAGPMAVTGIVFDDALSLRSTFITSMRTDVAEVAAGVPETEVDVSQAPVDLVPQLKAASASEPVAVAEPVAVEDVEAAILPTWRRFAEPRDHDGEATSGPTVIAAVVLAVVIVWGVRSPFAVRERGASFRMPLRRRTGTGVAAD